MADTSETKTEPFFVPPKPGDEVSRERTKSESSEEPASPEIEFKPIVSLPLVEVKTLEEDEEELIKVRAKLYRFETIEDPPEWKERGVGEVKLLKHRENGTVRILMRRDKTLKICANHYITPIMGLKKHANSDKAFVWSTHSDFSDGEPRPETLCIRFGNRENASKYQQVFEEARKLSSLNMSLELGKLNLDDSSCSEEEDEAETTAEEQEKVTNDSEVSPGASEKNTSEKNTSEKSTSETNTSETKNASESGEGKDVNGSVKEEKEKGEEAKDD